MRVRRTIGIVALAGAAAWCVVSVPRGYSDEGKPGVVPATGVVVKASAQPDAGGRVEAYKPVAPVASLMDAQDRFFSEIKEQLRARGKEDFLDIQINAHVLAELCNVNQYQKDKDDYREWATQARDLSVKLADAAKAKDAAAANGYMREIHTKCVACHDKYQ